MELKDAERGIWNVGKMEELFSEHLVKEIIKIPWPSFPCEDKLIWRGNAAETFTVKNNYVLKFSGSGIQNPSVGSKLWKLNFHKRFKFFLWRILAGILPSREIIGNLLGHGDMYCVICSAEVENYFHLFKRCHRVRALAFASRWNCLIDTLEASNIHDLVEMCIESKGNLVKLGMSKEFVSIFMTTLWYCT